MALPAGRGRGATAGGCIERGRLDVPELRSMPQIQVAPDALAEWGAIWLGAAGSENAAGGRQTKRPKCFDKKQGITFGRIFDDAFGAALATMLGDLRIVKPSPTALTPPDPHCIEVGTTRVIGGIRPQNYDVAYRPDGPRVVFDSKTLNDASSIRKNWQNMINDLASEAATVHTRFPFCIVAFIVVLPAPAVQEPQRRAIISTLERLGSRKDELDQHHLAEAISLVLWEPGNGQIDANLPAEGSPIQLRAMSQRMEMAYRDRYQHLPPHTT